MEGNDVWTCDACGWQGMDEDVGLDSEQQLQPLVLEIMQAGEGVTVDEESLLPIEEMAASELGSRHWISASIQSMLFDTYASTFHEAAPTMPYFDRVTFDRCVAAGEAHLQFLATYVGPWYETLPATAALRLARFLAVDTHEANSAVQRVALANRYLPTLIKVYGLGHPYVVEMQALQIA
jgi:hypothetical protein